MMSSIFPDGRQSSVNHLTASRKRSEQQSVAALRPDDHEPLNLTVSKTKSFSVRVKTPTQALMFVRFLLAKVVIRKDLTVLSDPEIALLSESWEILGKCKDQSFIKRWHKVVSNLRYIEMSRIGTKLNPKIDQTNWWNYLRHLPGLPSDCAYFGWWKTFRIKDWFRFRNRELDSKSSPKRFIGVGYQDSGTARDVAYDGSPRWQEVVGARLFFGLEEMAPLGAPNLRLRY